MSVLCHDIKNYKRPTANFILYKSKLIARENYDSLNSGWRIFYSKQSIKLGFIQGFELMVVMVVMVWMVSIDGSDGGGGMDGIY